MRLTRTRLMAGSLVAALGLAGCGGGSGQDTSAAGQPQRGGTLKLVGSSDVDHLDTVDAYYTVTNIVLRAFTRQLVTYPASNNKDERSTVVADLATEVPSQANGGITDGGKTYTFHLRPGVNWDTTPPRPVTAQDVVLGMKRLCNPVRPVPAPGYYENTIVGFQDYCEAFLKAPGTLAGISDFISSHDIAGVQATNDSTVVFRLRSPASDFINIMTLPFASPTPEEYLKYLPDSPELRTHTISDGPYRITSYEPNKEIDLARNPNWDAGADPLRKAYVDRITVTQGMDTTAVQQQLEAGTADMEWDTNVPPPSLPGLMASKDPRLVLTGAGTTNPYLAINFLSPNANRATSKLKVRQALEYAVNKKSVIQVLGGPKLGPALDTFLTPEINGYEQFNLYPTKDHQGDPAKAKQLLTEAGYPDGVELKLLYPTGGDGPKPRRCRPTWPGPTSPPPWCRPPRATSTPTSSRFRRWPGAACGTSPSPAGYRTGRVTRPARSSCRSWMAAPSPPARPTTATSTTPRSTRRSTRHCPHQTPTRPRSSGTRPTVGRWSRPRWCRSGRRNCRSSTPRGCRTSRSCR